MQKSLLRNSLVAAVIISAWLLLNAGRGLSACFTPDDIMNMYWAWTEPLRKLLLANVFPFASASYRPLGAVVYRTSLLLFGLNPTPLRIFLYALLLLNSWLVYRLAKRLTGSSEIGFLSAFLMSFHHRLEDIYVNTGTIYDVLCCTFYLVTLLFYIRARQRGSFRAINYVVLYALVVAALNSKEIGATLPVMLLGYEVIYRRPQPLKWRSLTRWLLVDATPVWMAAFVTALAIRSKMGAGSHYPGNPYYALHLSSRQYIATMHSYLNDLLLLPEDTLMKAGVIGVLLLVIAIAAISRRKYMWFCTLLIIVGPLPVNFIVPRGLFAIYTPMIGWAILAAGVLVEGRDWLYARVWKRVPLNTSAWEPERVFMFVVMVILLAEIHFHDRAINWSIGDWSKSSVYQLEASVRRLHPTIDKSSSILFLDDKFTRDDWIPVMLLRLMYRDSELKVDRVKMMVHPPQEAQLSHYSYVFDYQGDRLMRVEPRITGSSQTLGTGSESLSSPPDRAPE